MTSTRDNPALRKRRAALAQRGRLYGFRIPFSRYRREDGLPSGQIHAITQDAHGIIWLATPSGLARFDGCRFDTLTARDGLATHGQRTVTADRDGTVWVGSDAGVDHLAFDGRLLDQHEREAWHNGAVNCVELVGDQIWLGSDQGLFRRRSRAWHKVSDDIVQAVALAVDARSGQPAAWFVTVDGELLRGNDDALAAPEKNQWRAVGQARCVCPGTQNNTIVGGTLGLVEIDATGALVAQLASGYAGQPVNSVRMAQGDLWAGVGQSLCRLRKHGAVWEVDSVVSDHDAINALHVDTTGGIWAGTQGNGLIKVSPLHEMIRPLTFTQTNAVFTVRPGAGGTLLLGGDHFSAVLHRGNAPGYVSIEGLEGRQTWDLCEDDHGHIWAATDIGLIKVARDGRVSMPFPDDPVFARPCRALLLRGEDLWVGGKGGCKIVRADGSIGIIPTLDREPLGYVYSLVEDTSASLWIGTIGNGLWREVDGHLARLEHEHLSAIGNTYCVAVRADNTIAVAQDNRIVLRAPDGAVELLTISEEPIAGWTVQWSHNDDLLWAGTDSGLHGYDVHKRERAHQIIAVLGLSNWEFTTSRSLHITRDGKLYCGLNSGLVVVEPTAIDAEIAPPVARVARVEWKNAEPAMSDDGAFELDSQRWSLRVLLSCPWFMDEQDVTFRHRMVGFDEGWSALSSVAEARFNALPPGEYRLEVQAFSRLVGFGPAARMLTLRVRDKRFGRAWLLAPFRAARGLRDTLAALRRNRVLLEENTQLEEEINNRTAQLLRARDKLQQLNAALTAQVTTDPLTGISNRRQFDTTLERALAQALERHQPLSLVFIDIDHFKAYNDRYGHTRGDECLGFVARRIEGYLYRSTDVVARYGGEEFGAILPATDVGGAMAMAERLRESVERLQIRNEGAPGPGVVTVSIGVTTLPGHGELPGDSVTPQMIVANADAALYEAKECGRNQCIYHEFDFTLR